MNASKRGYNHFLHLYLAPEAITTETEILAYDVYNFLGDVGGVMGLMLGYSFLSVYDWCRQYWRQKERQWQIPLGNY